jgi:hypothetical protein
MVHGYCAKAEVTQDAVGTAFVTRANNVSPLEGLGTILNRTKNMMVVVYDFAVQGGAVGSVNLNDDQGNAAILPQGAIVQSVAAATVTDVTSPGSPTIALSLNASADLMAATAKTSLTSAVLLVGKPLGGASAGLWVGPVSPAAGKRVTADIATTAITAGKVKYFIEYVIR